jgi:hypothetical protein
MFKTADMRASKAERDLYLSQEDLADALRRYEQEHEEAIQVHRDYEDALKRVDEAKKALTTIANDLSHDPAYAMLARDVAESLAQDTLARLDATVPASQPPSGQCLCPMTVHYSGGHVVESMQRTGLTSNCPQHGTTSQPVQE